MSRRIIRRIRRIAGRVWIAFKPGTRKQTMQDRTPPPVESRCGLYSEQSQKPGRTRKRSTISTDTRTAILQKKKDRVPPKPGTRTGTLFRSGREAVPAIPAANRAGSTLEILILPGTVHGLDRDPASPDPVLTSTHFVPILQGSWIRPFGERSVRGARIDGPDPRSRFVPGFGSTSMFPAIIHQRPRHEPGWSSSGSLPSSAEQEPCVDVSP